MMYDVLLNMYNELVGQVTKLWVIIEIKSIFLVFGVAWGYWLFFNDMRTLVCWSKWQKNQGKEW